MAIDRRRKALAELMGSDNEWVRLWAATHSWDWSRIRAQATLSELSRGTGIAAFDAKWTLRSKLDQVPRN